MIFAVMSFIGKRFFNENVSQSQAIHGKSSALLFVETISLLRLCPFICRWYGVGGVLILFDPKTFIQIEAACKSEQGPQKCNEVERHE